MKEKMQFESLNSFLKQVKNPIDVELAKFYKIKSFTGKSILEKGSDSKSVQIMERMLGFTQNQALLVLLLRDRSAINSLYQSLTVVATKLNMKHTEARKILDKVYDLLSGKDVSILDVVDSEKVNMSSYGRKLILKDPEVRKVLDEVYKEYKPIKMPLGKRKGEIKKMSLEKKKSSRTNRSPKG